MTGHLNSTSPASFLVNSPIFPGQVPMYSPNRGPPGAHAHALCDCAADISIGWGHPDTESTKPFAAKLNGDMA